MCGTRCALSDRLPPTSTDPDEVAPPTAMIV
jgi:hypothetical protein